MSKKGSFLLGAAAGIGLGMLLAPKSGKETREDLKKSIDELIKKAKEIDIEEVKNTIIVKTKELETMIKDLDKETAKQMFLDKSNEVKIKAQELVNIAVEKGTPILEKTAKAVKAKTSELLKVASEKLDDSKDEAKAKSKKEK